MVARDLVLRAQLEDAELLIFPSDKLAEQFQRKIFDCSHFLLCSSPLQMKFERTFSLLGRHVSNFLLIDVLLCFVACLSYETSVCGEVVLMYLK